MCIFPVVGLSGIYRSQVPMLCPGALTACTKMGNNNIQEAIILNRVCMLLFIILITGCRTEPENIPGLDRELRIGLDLDSLFTGYSGSFLLKKIDSDKVYVYKDSLNWIRSGPASTFKIPHALIALQTGVITPTASTKNWDGNPKPITSWEADHSLHSALKNSVVWYFQETARDIGKSRMTWYLDLLDYGNRQIGAHIDKFWLNGTLLISPNEQLNFLERFYRHEFAFEESYYDLVRECIVYESNAGWTFSGKTGTVRDPRYGWFIGMLEKENSAYLFVIRIHGKDDTTGRRAMEITRSILESMHLIDG